MVSRYELTEAQWTCIQDFLPGRKESVGRTAKDNRSFVNGVLWALRSGARWSDLPERYGQYKTVHKRFTRWAVNGVWDRIFRMLTQDKSNQYLMIDSTIVRAHQQAATGRKKGGPGPSFGAFPRRADDENPPALPWLGTASRLFTHGWTS